MQRDPTNGTRDATKGALALSYFNLIQSYAFQYLLTTMLVKKNLWTASKTVNRSDDGKILKLL